MNALQFPIKFRKKNALELEQHGVVNNGSRLVTAHVVTRIKYRRNVAAITDRVFFSFVSFALQG